MAELHGCTQCSSEEYSDAHIAFGSMGIFRIDDRDLSWGRFGSGLRRESVVGAVAEGCVKGWHALRPGDV
jgi:hypothetical protein